MSKEPKPAGPSLNQVAGQVHTFDSFGRAIVASALKQAEKSPTFDRAKVTATVSVVPFDAPPATFAGLAASGAGGHAKGTVAAPAFSLTICFGDDCHVISL